MDSRHLRFDSCVAWLPRIRIKLRLLLMAIQYASAELPDNKKMGANAEALCFLSEAFYRSCEFMLEYEQIISKPILLPSNAYLEAL